MDYHEKPNYTFAFRMRPRLSPMVKRLIIINALAFLLQIIVLSAVRNDLARYHAIFGWLSLSPRMVFGKGCIWQLVTYAFLHSPFRWTHILFNMLCLYWFGREVETVLGSRRFLHFYLTAAVVAGLTFSAVHLFRDVTFCVGASGAVMALMMAYALWYPDRKILFMLIFPMRMRTFVTVMIVIEVLSFLKVQNDVANMAHLGGLVYGYLYVRQWPRLAARLSGGRGGSTGDRGSTADPGDDQRRLDDILDKIQREGMGALSWSEKRFLRRMSGRR